MRIALLFLSMVVLSSCTETPKTMNEVPLFIGTYTNGDSSGIYRLHFNTETGALGQKTLMAEMENPSFLAISQDRKHLFAVSEINTLKDDSGGVQAFTITADSLVPNGKMEL